MIRPMCLALTSMLIGQGLICVTTVARAAEVQKVFEDSDSGIIRPVVSNSGLIAFHSTKGDEISIKVFDGSVYDVIGTSPSLPYIHALNDLLGINSSGSIVFVGESAEGSAGESCATLYLFESQDLIPIDDCRNSEGWSWLSVSESGNVLYAKLVGDRSSIVSNVRGVETVLLGGPDETWLFPIQNDLGVIAAHEYDSDRLVIQHPGGPRIVVAGSSGNYCIAFPWSINNSGVLVFVAFSCLTNERTVYRYSNGEVTALVSTTDPDSGFAGFDGAYVNDAGDIFFLARLLAGGSGLYRYRTSGIEEIVRKGDAADGREIYSILLSRDPLDNFGNVAFFAYLTDGSGVDPAIFVARTKADSSAGGGGGSISLLLVLCMVIVGLRRIEGRGRQSR